MLSELDEMADLAVFVHEGRTVRVEDLGGDGAAGGRYLITALDVRALLPVLERYAVAYRQQQGRRQDSVSVEVTSADDAADLLSILVREGVRVVAFTPEASRLETAYLELDRMRSATPAGDDVGRTGGAGRASWRAGRRGNR